MALDTLTLSGGTALSVLSPAGPVASAERTILLDSLGIMLAIVIPTIIATLVFAWWFRASNPRARYQPKWAYSGRIELIIWSIPTLVILFLGGITWLSAHQLDPARPLASRAHPLEIQVVSLDWKWLFIYPEQKIASINRIVAPAGMPVHFSLTSASVFNVFFVPRVGSEIYAMNGMTTQLYLQADQRGRYPGRSAHFSGDGFAAMNYDFLAVSPQEFTDWVDAARRGGRQLDRAAYRELERQTQNVVPYTYGSVGDGLFSDIVLQKLPPGDGPDIARAGKEK